MVGVFRSEVKQSHEGNRVDARPWHATGSVDVERLAAWAYGVQMVDRFERVGLHAIEAEAAGLEPSSYSADGCGMLMAIDHLGCRVDGGGSLVRDTVHPVAYAVAAAIGDMGKAGSLVRQYAQAGTRPTAWRPPEHKVRPRVWVKDGERAQVEYLGPGRAGAHCSVIVVWDQQREAWGRALYRQWWDGLADLAWRLSMKALGFAVTGPEALGEPWLVDEAKRAESSSISIDKPSRADPPRGSSQGGA